MALQQTKQSLIEDRHTVLLRQFSEANWTEGREPYAVTERVCVFLFWLGSDTHTHTHKAGFYLLLELASDCPYPAAQYRQVRQG